MFLERTRGAAAALAVLLSLAALAQPKPRCELPETGPYGKAVRLCMNDMPDSRPHCRNFLDELASIEDRSIDQALALAFGRAFAAAFEDDYDGEVAKADQAGREMLKPFVDATPDDPTLLKAYAFFYLDDWEQYWAMLRRVLALDPACSWAAFSLSDSLGRSDDDAHRLESSKYLTHGYRYSEGTWKLLFAYRKHEKLKRSRPEDAEAFRAQVAADMRLRDLPLDAESRADSMEVLCNGNALELRLEAYCADAIEVLAARDRRENGALGVDVLEAVGMIAGAAEEGELGDDGARHQRRWRQLLEAEPERRRSARFYVIYSRLLRPTAGVDAEVGALRRALDMDPRSGEIGLYLTAALKRAGRPEQAKEVYRHIIANADDRAVEDGKPADYYAERAAQYLRELEAGEHRRTEVSGRLRTQTIR